MMPEGNKVFPTFHPDIQKEPTIHDSKWEGAKWRMEGIFLGASKRKIRRIELTAEKCQVCEISKIQVISSWLQTTKAPNCF